MALSLSALVILYGAMRILLAENQPNVRSALRLLIQEQPGVELVGEESSARTLFASIARSEPDVLLLQWELPGASPRDLIRNLRITYPALTVIVMSSRRDMEEQALQAGAAAFVSKAESVDGLLSALEAFARGPRRSIGTGQRL